MFGAMKLKTESNYMFNEEPFYDVTDANADYEKHLKSQIKKLLCPFCGIDDVFLANYDESFVWVICDNKCGDFGLVMSECCQSIFPCQCLDEPPEVHH